MAETSIPSSKETLKILNQIKLNYDCKTLESTITLLIDEFLDTEIKSDSRGVSDSKSSRSNGGCKE